MPNVCVKICDRFCLDILKMEQREYLGRSNAKRLLLKNKKDRKTPV